MRVVSFALKKETSQHLLFDFVDAKYCWFLIYEVIGILVGESVVDIGKFWLSSKKVSFRILLPQPFSGRFGNSRISIVFIVLAGKVWRCEENQVCGEDGAVAPQYP